MRGLHTDLLDLLVPHCPECGRRKHTALLSWPGSGRAVHQECKHRRMVRAKQRGLLDHEAKLLLDAWPVPRGVHITRHRLAQLLTPTELQAQSPGVVYGTATRLRPALLYLQRMGIVREEGVDVWVLL